MDGAELGDVLGAALAEEVDQGLDLSSGALAPEVMPTVSTPPSHSSRTWVWLSIRCEAAPCSRATSTRRLELEELVEPITRTSSHSRASCLTAIWRLVVA